MAVEAVAWKLAVRLAVFQSVSLSRYRYSMGLDRAGPLEIPAAAVELRPMPFVSINQPQVRLIVRLPVAKAGYRPKPPPQPLE